MRFLSVMAIAVALAVGCGQDSSQEDSTPTAQARQLPAPAATTAPAPEPPTHVPPTPRPPQPPQQAPTAAPAPTQPPPIPSATPLALSGRITPTATATPWPTPTQIPKTARDAELSELAMEYRMRCLHYVRENEQPVTYAEFRDLDPDNMTDLERVLWGQIGGDSEFRRYCQDYWSEPLLAKNAHKRNESYRDKCYKELWHRRESYLQYEDHRWDQFSRIANWLDIPGDDLLEMSPRPLDLVEAEWERRQRGYEPEPQDEWYGILEVWPYHDDWFYPDYLYGKGHPEECVYYYPQLFTGRWIPLDTALTRHEIQERKRFETPTPTPMEMRSWISQRDRPVFRGN